MGNIITKTSDEPFKLEMDPSKWNMDLSKWAMDPKETAPGFLAQDKMKHGADCAAIGAGVFMVGLLGAPLLGANNALLKLGEKALDKGFKIGVNGLAETDLKEFGSQKMKAFGLAKKDLKATETLGGSPIDQSLRRIVALSEHCIGTVLKASDARSDSRYAVVVSRTFVVALSRGSGTSSFRNASQSLEVMSLNDFLLKNIPYQIDTEAVLEKILRNDHTLFKNCIDQERNPEKKLGLLMERIGGSFCYPKVYSQTSSRKAMRTFVEVMDWLANKISFSSNQDFLNALDQIENPFKWYAPDENDLRCDFLPSPRPGSHKIAELCPGDLLRCRLEKLAEWKSESVTFAASHFGIFIGSSHGVEWCISLYQEGIRVNTTKPIPYQNTNHHLYTSNKDWPAVCCAEKKGDNKSVLVRAFQAYDEQERNGLGMKYDLLNHNCQDFVWECILGKEELKRREHRIVRSDQKVNIMLANHLKRDELKKKIFDGDKMILT